MHPDRVVFDTNIFVSLILKSNLDFLVYLKNDFNVHVYICEELLNELGDVLLRPKIKNKLRLPPKDYLLFIKRTTRFETIDKRFDRSPDVKDNYLFDLAYSVKSFLLITNDKPIRNMKQVNQIKIISFHDFKKSFLKVT